MTADRDPLWELRLEGSSPSAVLFSDPCPICGCKKRRCLLPPAAQRKRLLVTSPDTRDARSTCLCSHGFPASPPASPAAGSPLLRNFFNSPNTSEKSAGYGVCYSPQSSPAADRGLFGSDKSVGSLQFHTPKPKEIPPMVHPPWKDAGGRKEEVCCGGGGSDMERKGSEKSLVENGCNVEEESVEKEHGKERMMTSVCITCKCGAEHRIAF